VPVRRLLVDDALDLGPQAAGVERELAIAPLDLGPWAPNEVLLVSADAELLAEAGALGIHRIVADEPAATAGAVRQFVDFLDR
jgi:hypothetical protein